MPSVYEMIFWIGAFITVATLWGVFFTEDVALYLSDYELDRLNGKKY